MLKALPASSAPARGMALATLDGPEANNMAQCAACREPKPQALPVSDGPLPARLPCCRSAPPPSSGIGKGRVREGLMLPENRSGREMIEAPIAASVASG